MSEFLQTAFALLCGQHLEHTWAPGGLALPCCQRCTGLYVGAALALLLHALFRPRPTTGHLWLHGMFLLQMVPFGYQWLPQGPVLRTETGLLFGFGLVAFLWLVVGSRLSPLPKVSPETAALGDSPAPAAAALPRVKSVAPSYLIGLAGILLLVPVTALWGARPGALVLAWLAAVGAGVLLMLVLVNAGGAVAALVTLAREATQSPRFPAGGRPHTAAPLARHP